MRKETRPVFGNWKCPLGGKEVIRIAARPHAPLTAGLLSFAYDANGNTTTDGSRTLAWNEADRLESVTLPSLAKVVFGYDADG